LDIELNVIYLTGEKGYLKGSEISIGVRGEMKSRKPWRGGIIIKASCFYIALCSALC
jgi:hypothetical protein